MADTNELLGVVDAVIGALRRHHIAHFITGSLASSVHGEFRATNDIDIVAQLHTSQLSSLFHELASSFVADLAQATASLERSSGFNLIHRSTYLKVDVFPCVTDFDRHAIIRAVELRVPGAAEGLHVASVEDILLAKLRWYRPGGESSAIQLRDVQRLIDLNRDELDLAHLRHWAAALGVDDLLIRALA